MKHPIRALIALLTLPTLTALTTVQADEVSPLRQRLAQMDAMRTGTNTPFVEVEKQGRELLRRYTLPDDRAQIYFELAHVYAQSDIRLHPDRVTHYARLALASERDPIQRGILYSYLGSAAEIDPTQLTFSAQRAKAAAVWLQGYKELLPLHLPAVSPELPIIEKLDSDLPDPSQREAVRLKRDAQVKAREEAESLRQLIANRDIFVQQLKEVYAREPRADTEITKLTLRVLADKSAANALLAQILTK